MKKLLMGSALACCLAFGVTSLPERAGAQAQAGAIVIQGGTLIDGNGGAPVPNSVVVIEGDRITAVGRSGAVRIPAGATMIDAAGKYVLPGLWDSQINYAWHWGEAFLNQGITSVVDIGIGEEVSVAQREGEKLGKITGPRMFIGIGRMVSLGPPLTGLETPLSARQNPKTAEEARALGKRLADAGADQIMAQDGTYPIEFYQALFDEAKKAGKPASCRCNGPKVGPREGALAGAEIFPHSSGIWAAVAKEGTPRTANVLDMYSAMDDQKAKDLIKVLVEHHVSLVPTFVHEAPSYPKGWARWEEEDRKLVSDPDLLAYFDEDNIRNSLANYTRVDPPGPVRDRRIKGFQNMLRFHKMYDEAGGHVIAGGDNNNNKLPGMLIHAEYETMAEAGIPPMHIIMGASKWPAEMMHWGDRLGTVEAGKIADVIVVDADPLANIENLRKVSAVIHNGKQFALGYRAWYSTPFKGGADDRPVVENLGWTTALKRAQRPGALVEAGVPGVMPAGGLGPNGPNPTDSPEPAIETIAPVMITEGSPTTTLTITGFNFVRRSLVLFNGESVPYKHVSGTELQVTLDADLLKRVGRFDLVVQNPQPVANPIWGNGTSNKAHLIVMYPSYDVRIANGAR